jgi:hypothetical protein
MKPRVNLESLTLYEQAYSVGHLEAGSEILKGSMSSIISKPAAPSSVLRPASKPVLSFSLGSVHSNCSINRPSEKDHIVVAIGTSPKTKNKHVHGFRKESESSSISDFICTREPLKYSEAEEDNESRQSSSNDSKGECDSSEVSNASSIEDDTGSRSSKRKNLTFNQYVDVIAIPSRNEYSRRIRAKLWSTAVELHLNAHRNTIEFAADGWDWRSATEEDQMPMCPTTKQLMHPIHVCDNTQICNSYDENVSCETDICQISSEPTSKV